MSARSPPAGAETMLCANLLPSRYTPGVGFSIRACVAPVALAVIGRYRILAQKWRAGSEPRPAFISALTVSRSNKFLQALIPSGAFGARCHAPRVPRGSLREQIHGASPVLPILGRLKAASLPTMHLAAPRAPNRGDCPPAVRGRAEQDGPDRSSFGFAEDEPLIGAVGFGGLKLHDLMAGDLAMDGASHSDGPPGVLGRFYRIVVFVRLRIPPGRLLANPTSHLKRVRLH